MLKKNLFLLLAAATIHTTAAPAQNAYAEIARLSAMNESVSGIRSMADGAHYTTLQGNDIRRYRYDTATPGESLLPQPAPNLAITDYLLSSDEQSILIASGRNPIYRRSYTTSYSLVRNNTIEPILRDAEAPRDASFSPDGRLIAYSDRKGFTDSYDAMAGRLERHIGMALKQKEYGIVSSDRGKTGLENIKG